jgi:hypothetical protein
VRGPEARQRKAIEEYAWASGAVIVDWFYDVAVSGADPIEARPGCAALLARIADVNGILRDRGYVEDRNRELLERVIAEPQRYHWVRISNEDIGEPGCRHWHSRPRFGLIGMLMGWWRVKLSSGCPLAEGARRPGNS